MGERCIKDAGGRRVIAVGVILLFGMIAGCALFGTNTKDFVDMTPKEKSTYFMRWYSLQYDDAVQMGELAKAGSLTEAQKSVYRLKKEVLTKAKPLVAGYDLLVVSGITPGADQEKEILALINHLATAGGK
jgi:hypothetical protein